MYKIINREYIVFTQMAFNSINNMYINMHLHVGSKLYTQWQSIKSYLCMYVCIYICRHMHE